MTAPSDNRRSDRRVALLFWVVVFGATMLLYADTFLSIVTIWRTSDAYLHGFLIPAISAFVIWTQRAALLECEFSAAKPGVVALVALSALWLLSNVLGIQLLEQIFAVAMIPASVLTVFGREVFRTIRFALLYLLFAVPFGEFLIPYLIDFTASFSVDVLNLLGIPVFRDGRYFQIPTGNYEVAKACSGLKYIVATFALTTLYSYFVFAATTKRLLFIGFALVLAVVANGVRATTVVLLLHFTDLDIAAGPDHEFVGWLIYAFMVVLLAWIGRRFQDRSINPELDRPVHEGRGGRLQPGSIVSASALAIAAVSIGPILLPFTLSATSNAAIEPVRLPAGTDGWVAIEPADTSWQPIYSGNPDLTLGRYENYAIGDVDVAVVRYTSSRQGGEITNSTNKVIDDRAWTLDGALPVTVDVTDEERFRVREVRARRDGEARLIWYWMYVNGERVDGVLSAKLAELRHMIGGGGSVSAAIVISSRIRRTQQDTVRVLGQFVEVFHRELQKCLNKADDSAVCDHGVSIYGEG